MNKLLHANFRRLKKDLVFWLCAAFMFAAGVYVSLIAEASVDRVIFAYALLIGLVSSVFCGLFIGVEHGDGTLRNKLIVGHTKTSVYLANLVVCVVAGFTFCFAFIVPMLAIGIPRLGFFEMGLLPVLALMGISLVMTAAFTGIYLLIAMLCQNKAVSAVACILCFVALMSLAAGVHSSLQEPEFMDSYVATIDGISKHHNEPNPRYLTGPKRERYQFFLEFLPTGQALAFIELSMIHTWQLPVYSLLILLLTTVSGVFGFRKKDIR